MESKIWYLERFNLFSDLNANERAFICKHTIMKTLDTGENVYFQDALANSVYFLKMGKIRISKITSTGEEFILSILEKGEIFGNSLLKNNHRTETAIVEEKVTYCIMTNDKFRELLLLSPALNFKFSQLLEERLEKFQEKLYNISSKNNEQRIIDFLREKAHLSTKLYEGEIIIKNSLTHKKIAQLTNTSRQEVSRVLSALRKNNLIEYNRKEIRILEPNLFNIV